MARRKQWIVKYTFPPTAWEEWTSFCVPPLCLMQNPIGNTCGTWAATALLLITCHPCPFNSVCFLFSVLSPRLIKKGYAIIRYTQAEFKCGKYEPSFCCTKIWSNKILYSLNWMFSLYILLWDLLSNVWILGSFCVCLCSCLGKVRVCVRGEFIRGDMSISGGVQKAEAKVIGQAGGIRQLSLTIKTYCVPVLVCACVHVIGRASLWVRSHWAETGNRHTAPCVWFVTPSPTTSLKAQIKTVSSERQKSFFISLFLIYLNGIHRVLLEATKIGTNIWYNNYL